MQCPRRVTAIFFFPPSLRLCFFEWGSSYRSLIIVWCTRVKMPAIYSHYGGGGLEPRTAIEGLFSAWGVSENWIAGSAAAKLFFLTEIAIAIATRPFKFHETSVSYTSSSFVSSIHSLDLRHQAAVVEFRFVKNIRNGETILVSHFQDPPLPMALEMYFPASKSLRPAPYTQ